MEIICELNKYKDEKYALFLSRSIPNISKDIIIGVRVPILRKIADGMFKSNYQEFLDELPHKYYEENLIHSILLSKIKDFDKCIYEINRFLKYIDNWAVCDTLSPKVFKKHNDEVIVYIKKWIKSRDVYTVRFGIDMLMSNYLDDGFKTEYLDMANIKSNEYYINMMKSWYYATALAKKWDDTIKILEEKKLDKWVHNKTIQKACESFRITNEQKVYLKSLKEKD